MTLALAVIISLLPYAGYYFLKQLLDEFIKVPEVAKPFIWKPVIGLAVVWTSLPLLQSWLQYHQETFDQIIQNHFGQLILGKSTRVEVSYYENPDYFDTLHRAQEEVTYRPALMVQAVVTFLQGLSGALVALFVLVYHAWWLAIIFILSALPLVMVRVYYSRKLHTDHVATTGMRRKAWYIHTVLTGKVWVKELRIYQFASAWIKKYRQLQQLLVQRQAHILKAKSKGAAITQLFEIGILVFALVFFAQRTWTGLITIGTFVLMVQVLQRGQSALHQVLQGLVQLYHHQLFANHIFTFLHLPEEITDEHETAWSKYLSPQVITLNDVTFHYPGQQNAALRGVNLTWKRGEVLAVVGQNGSGKTTLVNLLNLFYPQYLGIIAADNQDIRDIHPEEWRKNVAVVNQDFGNYQITIAENVSLSQAAAPIDENKLTEVLKITQADEFIRDWPQGVNTPLGKQYAAGEELSGGQWQRLAISRALYKEADVLILDEPTSAIDPLGEYALLQKIKKRYAQRFILLITHRLNNLKLADNILVLDSGQVVETGTYAQLIHNGGTFYNLFQHQL